MNSQKTWIICCIFNFLIASLMGLLLRFLYLFPLNSINYNFLLHAHSHVAMLGWVYLIIYVLIVHFFIPKEKRKKPIYNQLFWVSEFSVIGMMIAFPIQGYALFSIIFSTLHILVSYIFCWLVWKDCSKEKSSQKLLLTAVLFMFFSTFGVWCLGPALSIQGKHSAFYQIAIQFFLHFQFNGWFIIAVLALFLKQFKKPFDKKYFNRFLYLLIVSIFLTFAFPVSWYISNAFLKWINCIGVILQMTAFVSFYKMLKPQIYSFKENLNLTVKMAYGLALSSLFLKVTFQLLVLFPNLAEASHQIRNFIIGFIHLTTLGIITGFLFGILIQNKLLSNQSYWLRLGIIFFFLGYLMTEVLLFLQGGFLYFNKGIFSKYYESIFGTSIFIAAGLLLILMSVIKTKKQESIN
ncbi:hypothetical protein GKZ90_0024030 [Flavobacterium sp. MC2016-06]|uniref:hypothetical protein n=1 Tax=Flavobacterium sp. MC2016-06 TaxID=2676308 RepID=UPI0012BA6D5B|nr:hypothetical protein [Flavobacterium sp. MC2016-06]MBU3860690.1 hypothetical protein [Flavobacterium sp. MC2016-06]